MTDIGTKARDLFAPSTFKMSDNDKKNRQDMLSCFQKTSKQLQAKLPFNTFLKSFTFLNPMKRNHSGSIEGISNVTLKVCNAFVKCNQDSVSKECYGC